MKRRGFIGALGCLFIASTVGADIVSNISSNRVISSGDLAEQALEEAMMAMDEYGDLHKSRRCVVGDRWWNGKPCD